MLFAQPPPDMWPAFWTAFFAGLPALIAAIAAFVKCLQNSQALVKVDSKAQRGIDQNSEIQKSLNGHLSDAVQTAHAAAYAQGIRDAAAASVSTIAAAVAVGVAAAAKAERDKPST
jgi:hypothetical protein